MRLKDQCERNEIGVRVLRSDVDRLESKMKLLSVEWDDMLVRLQKAYRRVERGNSRSRLAEQQTLPLSTPPDALEEASDAFSKKLKQVRDQGADTRGVEQGAG